VSFSKRIASRTRNRYAEKIPHHGMSSLTNRKERKEEREKNAECIKRTAAFATLSRHYSARPYRIDIPIPRIPLSVRRWTAALRTSRQWGSGGDGLHSNCIRQGDARSDGGRCIDCTLLASAHATLTFAQLTTRMTANWALRSASPHRENVGKPAEN